MSIVWQCQFCSSRFADTITTDPTTGRKRGTEGVYRLRKHVGRVHNCWSKLT